MDLVFGNVRCFADDQRVPIRPLTLLVGENSTGKSTVLSLLHSVLQADFPSFEKLFNRPPFELGGFDTIATNRGGRGGRSKDFHVGFERKDAKLKVHFASADGALAIKRFEGEIPKVRVKYEVHADGPLIEYRYELSNGAIKQFSVPVNRSIASDLGQMIRFGAFDYAFAESASGSKPGLTSAEQDQIRHMAMNFYMEVFLGKPSVRAIAPLRTVPTRTYETTLEDVDPGGNHVPRVLNRHAGKTDKKSRQLFELLRKYGGEAGLFRDLCIRNLGNRPSDPFQVRVKTFGPDVNLTDVGYGVSQSLPIMVDTWSTDRDGWLLIQQPEVHLHPRAQAALGSLFAEEVASGNKTLVVETHSDYLIDRIRTAVASGVIPASSVQIVFFERSEFDAKIWPISLDDDGNILDAPDCYRQFFLEEELSLMRRGDR